MRCDALAIVFAISLAIVVRAQERVDVAAIERIKTEAFEHSHVMEHASWMTDVYGPRLTGSPITKAACDWAVETLQGWGLRNVHLEPWGPNATGIPGALWTEEDRG